MALGLVEELAARLRDKRAAEDEKQNGQQNSDVPGYSQQDKLLIAHRRSARARQSGQSTLLWVKLASVHGGHDVAVDCIQDLSAGHSPGHRALKKIARGPIAVITADAEEDGSFLSHWLIADGKRDRAGSGQGAGLGVALVNSVGVLTVTGAHVGDEGGAGGHFEVAIDAVLHVEPFVGTAWVAMTHDVDGVHMAGFVVEIVGLGVAEVETALFVEMKGGGYHVDALGLTMDRCLFRLVVAVAHASRDGDAVDLVSGHGNWKSVGHGGEVVAVGAGTVRGAAGWRRRQVVVVGGLVVEFGDGAGSVRTEGVLPGGVGVAVGEKANVGLGFIGLPRDLIDGAGVRAVQGAGGAEGRNTRCGRGEKITRTRCVGLR